ncbi:hypothetical protein HUU05_25420 [candidate division KSB1 bacterium]|nr:hypothetical protein [candidate division KSB1 bacterium]
MAPLKGTVRAKILAGFLITFLFSAELFAQKYDPSTLVFPPILHIWVQKATSTHLRLYTKGQVKVKDPQGVAAIRLDSWEDAKRTEDDDELTVYGVNAGYNMIIYNTAKTTLSFYGINESGEKRLKQPHGISAHRSGEVYLADTGNNRVVHFFNPGRELKYVRALTGLNAPRDVAMGADRTVYVADTGNHRVLVYREDQLERALPASAPLQNPSGIAVTQGSEAWSYFHDSFLVVIDQDAKRVQKLSLDGEVLATWSALEHGKPNAKLAYIAIDYYSNIYVTDLGNHGIHKFDRNLTYLTFYGRRGNGEKEFQEPRGIAIYKRFGQVLIADKESAQYYWVGTDVTNFTAAPQDNPALLRLDYFLTEASYVKVEILDERNQLLATAMEKILRMPGPRQEWLDGNWRPVDAALLGANNAAPSVPLKPGTYRIRLTAQPTYSSFNHFEKRVETGVSFRD